MNELSLFTGAGGGLLGTKLLGFNHIGYVELDEYRQQVIAQRISEGAIPWAPIFTDVREFIQSGAAEQYRGFAHLVTAGFPCPPFSVSGKRDAENDERNLWPETLDVINAVRPPLAFLENVAGLLTDKYVRRIFGELAESGYDARWCCLSSAELGADHKRDRVWILAYSQETGWSWSLRSNNRNSQKSSGPRLQTPRTLDSLRACFTEFEKRMGEPAVFRMDDGLAYQVDRLAAAGDGQDPRVVKAAWELLTNDL